MSVGIRTGARNWQKNNQSLKPSTQGKPCTLVLILLKMVVHSKQCSSNYKAQFCPSSLFLLLARHQLAVILKHLHRLVYWASIKNIYCT